MATINEDFWPDLNLAPAVTPLSILREQAGLLTQRTGGVLRGAVETWSEGERVAHTFNIVVPALGGYKRTLFTVYHNPLGYPISVETDPKPVFGIPTEPQTIADENQFRNWLRSMLRSSDVKRIVESLYAQASA
jgi:hypothetical protein